MRHHRSLLAWVFSLASCSRGVSASPDASPLVDVSRLVDASPDVVDAPAAEDTPVADVDREPPAFAYALTFSDPTGALTAERDALLIAARAGLDEWGRYVTGSGTLTVELRVMNTATGRFAGASTSNVPLGPCRASPAPCTVVEEQAIRRLRTGEDHPVTPEQADVAVSIAPDYVRSQLWFDPDPAQRTATVPSNRLDAISVFTHEIGHALGMTGFRSLTTFQPTVAFQSLFDERVRVGEGTLVFEGETTRAMFGPLTLTRTNTTQNVYHYGDRAAPGPFDDALMNGIVYRYGRRYRVGSVDLAIVSDLGVPLRRPL